MNKLQTNTFLTSVTLFIWYVKVQGKILLQRNKLKLVLVSVFTICIFLNNTHMHTHITQNYSFKTKFQVSKLHTNIYTKSFPCS